MKYPKRKDKYNCDLFCDNFHEIDHRLKNLEDGSEDAVAYKVGHGLKLDESNNELSVDSVDNFDGDNTLPASATLVQTTVGNIEILLKTI